MCNISPRVTIPNVGCCFVRPRSSSVTCSNRTRLAFRARANAAASCSGASDAVPACGSFGSKSTNSCPAKKAWKRTGKTRRSASSKCCKQWSESNLLLWRPETSGLTHHLFISNQTEGAQRRGTRKLRANQSGLHEEQVLRGKGRVYRTNIL